MFSKVLKPGRYPRGFLDPVGFTPVDYEPERTHLDLIRTIFHVFLLDSGILEPGGGPVLSVLSGFGLREPGGGPVLSVL